MEHYEPYVSLFFALAVGFLIGLQRQQAAAQEEAPRTLGGVRTFPLIALAGALAALLGVVVGWWLLAAGMLVLSALVGLSYASDLRDQRGHGITTEIAILITYLLGAACVIPGAIEPPTRRLLVIAAVAVATTGLLALKGALHTFAARVSEEDLYATVKFLVLAIIVLPLLPDAAYGPLAAFNPQKIGWMIVLIATLSFIGYASGRALGSRRGLAVTAVLGGLVSSTAVTLSFAGRSRRQESIALACARGVILASTILFVRVGVVVAVVHPALLRTLAPALTAATVTGVVAFLIQRPRAAGPASDELELKNPFELGSALRFGALFAAVLWISKAATTFFREAGAYVASALAGLTDVDAITLSMAQLSDEGHVESRVAATAILTAAVSNTLVKGGMALALGAPSFRRRVALSFAAMLAAGACAHVVSIALA